MRFPLRLSPLIQHVVGVFLGGSKEKVSGIDATRIVASVEHPEPLWNWPHKKLIGKTVRAGAMSALLGGHRSVTSAVGSNPRDAPRFGGFPHMVAKSLDKRTLSPAACALAGAISPAALLDGAWTKAKLFSALGARTLDSRLALTSGRAGSGAVSPSACFDDAGSGRELGSACFADPVNPGRLRRSHDVFPLLRRAIVVRASQMFKHLGRSFHYSVSRIYIQPSPVLMFT